MQVYKYRKKGAKLIIIPLRIRMIKEEYLGSKAIQTHTLRKFTRDLIIIWSIKIKIGLVKNKISI
jgi:hypothetical protein